jgi:hypothetical protein
MALTDGPLIVGYDFSSGAGEIWQIQAGGITKIKTLPQAGAIQYRFYDGVYWPEDDAVYIVGESRQTINGQIIDGKIWRFDGTDLTEDYPGSAQFGDDNYAITTITLFNNELYAGGKYVDSGSTKGAYVYNKATTSGSWTTAYSLSSTAVEGVRVLREDNGFLLLIPKVPYGNSAPAGYYYTTDGASWSQGSDINSSYDPCIMFWDSVSSKWRWGGHDGDLGAIQEYTTSTSDLSQNPSWGYDNQFAAEPNAGEIGKTSTPQWQTLVDFGTAVRQWTGSKWEDRFSIVGAASVGYDSARAAIREYLGTWYVATMEQAASNAYYYKDGTSYTFGVATTAASAVVPITIPDTWDILQIEPYKWGVVGPFCDETESGTTVYLGSHLEIDGTQGLGVPSYYDLQFGSTCSAVPTDWDMQLDVELTKLPALHDVNGARLVFWAYNPTTERKAAIALSKQGIAVYGLDTYAELVPNSNIFAEGDTVRIKLTVLSSDTDHQRAYLSVVRDGATLRVGFPSYENADGATGRIHVEAVGTPETPVQVNLEAVRLRDHAFDPGTDADSIDDTKPVAGIA